MALLELSDIPAEFERKLVARLGATQPEVADGDLRAHIDATLQFLGWCCLDEAPPLAPCPAVDAVWHEMIMFSADYRALCRKAGVGFIDHEPIENPGPTSPSARKTIDFVRSRGLEPRQPDLWTARGEARCCGGHVAL